MSFNANTFRQELKYGGARPTLFEVSLTFPSFVPSASAAGAKVTFMCKASQVPGMNLGTIEIPYFGRTIKTPGDRTFEDWTMTVINDEDYLVRNALEAWSNAIDQIDQDTETIRNEELEDINSYVIDITVKQFSKRGNIVKQYQLKNAHPSVIAPIELSWENKDTIEEFDVTFVYDYFVTQGFDAAGTLGQGTFSEASNTPS